jgi:hypothetical protein
VKRRVLTRFAELSEAKVNITPEVAHTHTDGLLQRALIRQAGIKAAAGRCWRFDLGAGGISAGRFWLPAGSSVVSRRYSEPRTRVVAMAREIVMLMANYARRLWHHGRSHPGSALRTSATSSSTSVGGHNHARYHPYRTFRNLSIFFVR